MIVGLPPCAATAGAAKPRESPTHARTNPPTTHFMFMLTLLLGESDPPRAKRGTSSALLVVASRPGLDEGKLRPPTDPSARMRFPPAQRAEFPRMASVSRRPSLGSGQADGLSAYLPDHASNLLEQTVCQPHVVSTPQKQRPKGIGHLLVTDNLPGILCPELPPFSLRTACAHQDLMPSFGGKPSAADQAAAHRAIPAATPGQDHDAVPHPLAIAATRRVIADMVCSAPVDDMAGTRVAISSLFMKCAFFRVIAR